MARSKHIDFNIGEEIFNLEVKEKKAITESEHKCGKENCECDSTNSTMVRLL